MPDEIGNITNVSNATRPIGGQDNQASQPEMTFGRVPGLKADPSSNKPQNGQSNQAIARMRSQSPHEDDKSNASRNIVTSFFKKIKFRSKTLRSTSNNPKYRKEITKKIDLTQSTQRLLENNGVELAAVSGEKATLKGKFIDVAVEVSGGTLADLPKLGYDVNAYSGENVVAPGRQFTLVSTSHLGTHSMAPCSPMIMILKNTETSALSVSLTHNVSMLKADEFNTKIESHESGGFEIVKIITGVHGDAKHFPRQYLDTKLAAEIAADRKIDFGLIKYNDAGKDSWWISVDVSDNSKVSIYIGNDNGLKQSPTC